MSEMPLVTTVRDGLIGGVTVGSVILRIPTNPSILNYKLQKYLSLNELYFFLLNNNNNNLFLIK